MDVVLLIVGLAGLWLGTEVTIHGAVSVANRFGVSEFVIGVAVLSVGSDLPELAIAVDAERPSRASRCCWSTGSTWPPC